MRPWVVALCLVLVVAITSTHAVSTEAELEVDLLKAHNEGRIIPAEPAIFLEVEQIEGSKQALGQDPVGDALFRQAELAAQQAKTLDDGNVDDIYLPPDKPRRSFLPATKAMAPEDLGVKDPKFDKRSQDLADPSSIKRECPRQRCPAAVKCADPTMTCCKTGNFSFCCPQGSTCLTTKVPMCLQESDDDPRACTEEVCASNFHCPLSQVASCCRGGTTCCPVNAKCTVGDPPTCKLISKWDFLNRPQPDPVELIKDASEFANKSQLTADGMAFRREPVALVPLRRTPAPTPAPTPQVLNPNTTVPPFQPPIEILQQRSRAAVNESTRRIESQPLPSLFRDQPTAPGRRSRQRSEIINGTRVTTTETQTTVVLPDGGLKTVTQVHRVVADLGGNERANVWSNNPDETVRKALRRLRTSVTPPRQHPNILAKSPAEIAQMVQSLEQTARAVVGTSALAPKTAPSQGAPAASGSAPAAKPAAAPARAP